MVNLDHNGLILFQISNVLQLFQLQNKFELEKIIINLIIIIAVTRNNAVNNSFNNMINGNNSNKWDYDSNDNEYNGVFGTICRLF